MPEPSPSAAVTHVDFDLQGYVGVRLLEPLGRDRAIIAGQLGLPETELEGEPDITVRFVDRVVHGPLTFVSWRESAFDDRCFYLLTGRGNVQAKTVIPFESLGSRVDIVCERGLPTVPLLLALVNMTALSKGVLPLHASAFVHDGRGVLATGWAKGGKTESLLAFMARGARYVGDEWIYLTADGAMFGVPEPLRLWGWQVRQLPSIAARLRWSEKVRLGLLDGLAATTERVATRTGRGRAGSVVRRAAPVLRRQVNVQVPPARLFGREAMAGTATLDAVVFVSSHVDPDVRVRMIGGEDVARRMVASLEHEREPLLAVYRQFRFAFPERSSTVIERAPEIELELADRALAGRAVAWLAHPYPCRIESLFTAIDPILKAPRASRSLDVHSAP